MLERYYSPVICCGRILWQVSKIVGEIQTVAGIRCQSEMIALLVRFFANFVNYG